MTEKAKIVDTQQISRRSPSVSRQRSMSASDMRLPGERGIKRAAGMPKEGSFRMSSEAMDAITGNSNDNADMTVMQEPSL